MMLKTVTFIRIWMINVIQFWIMLTTVAFIQTTDDSVLHLDVNAWHPKLDDQLHVGMFILSFGLFLEKSIKKTSTFGWIWCNQSKHPKMD